MTPKELRCAQSHEWARLEKDCSEVTVGITEYAVEHLGDIVFLELPSPGDEVKQGSPFGAIESVKAASDLYAPVTGKVSAINEKIENNLELFKNDPYEQAWLIKIEPAGEGGGDFNTLMSSAEYDDYLKTQEEE